MQVIITAIWNYKDKVLTRPIELSKYTKELKVDGRRPNRIIIPESLKDKVLLRKVKRIGSYNCKIVKASGK